MASVLGNPHADFQEVLEMGLREVQGVSDTLDTSKDCQP